MSMLSARAARTMEWNAMRPPQPLRTPFLRSLSGGLLALVVIAHPAQSAHASPDTLRTSLANVLWAPFDVVAAPINGGIAVKRNLPYAGESIRERVAYVPAAAVGFTLLHVLAGGLRGVSGVLQLPVGLALFPFPNTDLPDSLDPLGRGEPLVGWTNPLGETPARYVLPITPITIDVGMGLLVPVAVYDRDAAPRMGRDDGHMTEETAP